MNKICIRHEDKYLLERRSPLVPDDIGDLISRLELDISVEHSEKRIFADEEFKDAGAAVVSDVTEADLVMGVKEMPENYFLPGKAYLFFSHVIKGQPYNMPMLQSLIDQKATLIDYEKITDNRGRRLIFFGRYAGLAGMINTLWAAGQRFEELGVRSPFSALKQSYQYSSLDDAISDIQEAGEVILDNGFSKEFEPLVIAVTGDGNVSNGAMEILDLVPGVEISAADLAKGELPDNAPVIKVNILPQDYLEHRDGSPFNLQHYIDHPGEYRSVFEKLLPKIDILVNGIYWDERYPKLVTKQWLRDQTESGNLRLKVIGDITCDVNGSIECTELAATIQDPVFIYNPLSDSHSMGFRGDGVAVMSVDILPSELPREASEHFSSVLKPFMPAFAAADFSVSFENLELPDEIKRAVIVHKGMLTPDFEYISQFL